MSEQQWPELRDQEWEISATEFEGDERAWRNVHPNHHIDGTLTSQIYDPSIKDEGQRSTAREARIDADAHFEEYAKSGRSSATGCAQFRYQYSTEKAYDGLTTHPMKRNSSGMPL